MAKTLKSSLMLGIQS